MASRNATATMTRRERVFCCRTNARILIMVGCVGEPKGSPEGRPVTPTLHSSPPLIGVSRGE
ncbi:hypothetical protein OS580_004160 [Escherichia coli]|nr:hypothetical protein [Escherichia coli]